jgi:hypothetical protein
MLLLFTHSQLLMESKLVLAWFHTCTHLQGSLRTVDAGPASAAPRPSGGWGRDLGAAAQAHTARDHPM